MKRKASSMKRFVAVVSVGTIAAGTLAGCGGSDSGSSASPSAGASTAPSVAASVAPTQQPPVELNIMLPIFKSNFPKDDSPVAAEIEKLANANIHFEWVPNSSYTDKFNITLASGKLPHIIAVLDTKSSSFVNAARSGAFWDLTNQLKDYKNLSGANKTVLNNTSIDGKVYGIYRGRDLGRNGYYYRKDWLEAVGLQEPKTIDDFYNMLKAFKEKDPDKNGKADTYGMVLVKWTGGWASGFDIMKLWFGAPNKWGIKDGKLVPEHQYEEYIDGLKFMKKLYDEKLINSDFAVFDSAKWVDPLVNNQAGVIVDVVDGGARVEDKIHAALAKDGKDDPNKQYMDVSSGVVGKDGKLRTLPTSGYAGMLAVPKSSVKTEAELKRVLTFIDRLNEPDLQTMLSYGLEGKHYTLDAEKNVTVSKDTVLMESEVEGLNQMLSFLPENKSLSVKQTPLRKKQVDTIKKNVDYIVSNPAEPLISSVYSQKGPQLENIINDARIKFIVGQLDEAGMRTAFETWKKSGGDELVKEMNELYTAAQKK
jgi:putative aldouronate transport system substrate-binding protein